ncbi:MAG: hypothetical protein JWR28_3448 [Modestobacter sp.]|nr:hypothetical protein [Modestobacter sp.]
MTGSGPGGPGGAAAVRTVTVTAYDENRPTTAAASIVDLATTVTEATLPGTAYAPASLVDRNVTTTAYDWNHGVPLSVVTDPGGLAITHSKTYDSLGRVTADVMPADTGAGTAAGTTVTAYYGPGAAGVCGSSAAATVWGGMVCSSGPAGTITGATTGSATTLPSTVTQYSRTGATTVATETSGSGSTAMVRTTTTSYDAADRPGRSPSPAPGPAGIPAPRPAPR